MENIVPQDNARAQRRFMDLSMVGDRPDGIIQRPEILPGLRAGVVAALTGDGAVGKSRTALQVCFATCSLTHDLPAIGNFPPPARALRGPVVFITTEDDEDDVHNMLTRIRIHLRETMTKRIADQIWSEVRPNLHVASQVAEDFELYDEQRRLRTHVLAQLTDAIKGHRLAIIDKLPDLAGVHEENNGMLMRILRDLRNLATQHDTAILVLHDHNKNASVENEFAAARGASSIRNKARAMYSMWPLPLADAARCGISANDAWQFALFRANKRNHGAVPSQCWLERRLDDAVGGVLVETTRIPQTFIPGTPLYKSAAERKQGPVYPSRVREYAIAD